MKPRLPSLVNHVNRTVNGGSKTLRAPDGLPKESRKEEPHASNGMSPNSVLRRNPIGPSCLAAVVAPPNDQLGETTILYIYPLRNPIEILPPLVFGDARELLAILNSSAAYGIRPFCHIVEQAIDCRGLFLCQRFANARSNHKVGAQLDSKIRDPCFFFLVHKSPVMVNRISSDGVDCKLLMDEWTPNKSEGSSVARQIAAWKQRLASIRQSSVWTLPRSAPIHSLTRLGNLLARGLVGTVMASMQFIRLPRSIANMSNGIGVGSRHPTRNP